MSSFNSCTFSGFVGRDPELRYFEDGKSLANFSIAVGNRQGDTLWITVKVWGKAALVIGDWVKKGSQIIVSGELQEESWDKDGVKKTKLVLNCQNFKLIGSKNGSESSGSKKEKTSAPKPSPRSSSVEEDMEDDIPF